MTTAAGPEFEKEVRNIARAIWPGMPGSGASTMYGGRERDCIFEQEHLVHYLEVTTSRTLHKVRTDSKKMVQYKTELDKRGKLVKLWIVTLDEPTADQRTHCKKTGIEILSIAEFRRHIIDANQYLEIRQNHMFGSAADPLTQGPDITRIKYQPVSIHREGVAAALAVKELAGMVGDGEQIVLLGDYGMGKSIHIREVFLILRKAFFASRGAASIPVVLNLREHWGQTDPAEALRRHADLIGFERPHQLVRAFNAGRLAVLLDGFDEVGATPWARLPTSRARDLRRNAVQLVSRFVSAVAGRGGILIAGREHYFDGRNELASALNLSHAALFMHLEEFTEEEAKHFLCEQGYGTSLPEWFPRRPLLLASLAAKGVINSALTELDGVEHYSAWDKLVDIVCKRESAIHQYIDTNGLRHMLERLASEARKTPSNLGPITEDQIAEAFRAEVGAYPDEAARPLLHRLPGLSARNQQDGTRNFMDDQMLDVLRAGPLFRYIENPWADPHASEWQHGIRHLGAQVAAQQLEAAGKTQSEVVLGAREATRRWHAPTLAIDCLQMSQAMGVSDEQIDFSGLEIDGGNCDVLDLVNLPAPTHIAMRNSIFGELILPTEPLKDVEIEDCIIEQIIGASEERNIPEWCKHCEIVRYDEAATNARILEESRQPIPVRVMLTILKKLYRQRGSGRKGNAFYRGLDDFSKGFVNDILGVLSQERLAFCSRKSGLDIWHRVAGQQQRALGIIDSTGRSDDPAVMKVKVLGEN